MELQSETWEPDSRWTGGCPHSIRSPMRPPDVKFEEVIPSFRQVHGTLARTSLRDPVAMLSRTASRLPAIRHHLLRVGQVIPVATHGALISSKSVRGEPCQVAIYPFHWIF
jgi:hypothetical protein